MKINREMICDTELISRYYDNDLNPEEYSDIEDHIDSCEKCRKSLAEYSKLTDSLKLTFNEPAEDDTLKVENRVIESIRRKNRAWWVRLADQVFARRILVPAIMTASIAILVTTFYTVDSDQGPGAIITSLSSSGSVVIMHTEATNQPIIWISENG
jgi:anti-sigma factor RsiW